VILPQALRAYGTSSRAVPPASFVSRLDRELIELLQELRVIQGGILSGFAHVTDFQRPR
jgi:hypothetical protein